MTQEFTIHQKIPSYNQYINANRSHWSRGAAFKRDLEDMIGWEISAQKIKPVEGLVTCSFHWVEPNKRRDIDNIYSGKKFILDALVKAGILQGDSQAHISDVADTYTVDKSNKEGAVVVRIASVI